MAKQTINLGTAPSGAGGDDRRSAWLKAIANFDELYSFIATGFNRENILGTVGQASGVPTGAIIQRGNNANGEYVRYADGTQICWSTAPTLVPPAGLSTFRWTFPIAFAVRPGFAAMTPDIGSASDPRQYVAVTQYAPATTGASVLFQTYMATVVGCGAFAIGRWF
ncbi:hypothetical protein ABGT16_05535 [Pseudomonas asiatica]|uniref:hypothetical protein n=1 Tax=Pseudomonas asiatica TaxID=2219225 RepID=UPI002A90308C|nr:hypothetical protein [Pseudomonas putida]MDY4320807.1 hypothetical protein [Pseudomonas putida]MDY4354094.1 hypothetical protein [Pseudomonas putida]